MQEKTKLSGGLVKKQKKSYILGKIFQRTIPMKRVNVVPQQQFVKIFPQQQLEQLLIGKCESSFIGSYDPKRAQTLHLDYDLPATNGQKYKKHDPYYNKWGTEFLTIAHGSARINGKVIEPGDVARVDTGEIVEIETTQNTKILTHIFPYCAPLVHQKFKAPEIQKARKDLGKIVSIVIIAKDIQYHICHAIMACINQTYQNIQIIIVDDTSTDSTLNKCYSMAKFDSRIEVYSESLGMNGVRRFGMGKAFGDYCLILDGDDWFTEDAVERLVGVATKKKSECIIFGFDHYNDKTHIFSNPVFPTYANMDALPVWREYDDQSAMETAKLNHTVWMVFFSLRLKDIVLKALIHIYQYEDLPLSITLFRYAANPLVYNFILHHYRRDRTGQSTENWTAVLPSQKQECLGISVRHALAQIDKDDWFYQLILLYKVDQIIDYEKHLCKDLHDKNGYEGWALKWTELSKLFPYSLGEHIVKEATKKRFLASYSVNK